MDFATLPPEINSGRMWSGPGPDSLMRAATSWDNMATRLYGIAADYRSVTSTLNWQGPAQIAMNQAAAPYIGWLNTTAAQAEQLAAQARAAASAYESALAAMVPPPMIETNLALRSLLTTTNFLGQFGPHIADAEAEYEQMWAQDADAMYAYAGASADASTVPPFTSPPAVNPAWLTGPGAAAVRASGSWALTASPDVMSAGYQVVSTIPEALEALSSAPLTTFEASLSSVTASLSKLSSLSAPRGFAISHLNSLNKMAALRTLIPNPGGVKGAAITAGFRRATSIGSLSVPRSWVTATAPLPISVEPLPRGWVCEPIPLAEPSEPPAYPSSR